MVRRCWVTLVTNFIGCIPIPLGGVQMTVVLIWERVKR